MYVLNSSSQLDHFSEPQTRKTISRSLCPPASGFTSLSSLLSGSDPSYNSRNDPPVAVLSAFFKEVTFNPNRCSHHNTITFRSEEDPDDVNDLSEGSGMFFNETRVAV